MTNVAEADPLDDMTDSELLEKLEGLQGDEARLAFLADYLGIYLEPSAEKFPDELWSDLDHMRCAMHQKRDPDSIKLAHLIEELLSAN
jgi:hypothetical protein